VSAVEDMLSEIDYEGMIALVMSGVLASSKKYREATKTVLREQRRLQRAIGKKEWRRYLALEEAVNDRASIEADLIVRWAFAAAARSMGRSSR
jgi:hypothetical protein